MLLRKKTKDNPFKSCLISLLALVGFIIACFLFCTLMFQINSATNSGSTQLLNLFLLNRSQKAFCSTRRLGVGASIPTLHNTDQVN